MEEIGGKPCIVVDVPPTSEPPHVYRDGIFVRRGTRSLRAAGADIAGLLQRRRQEPVRWERLPALSFALEELDQNEIARTVQQEQTNRWQASRQELSVEASLRLLNLAERGMPLNSAIVLFARQPARLYPQIRVRVARFASDNPSEIIDHRTFEGHVFRLVETDLTFLQAHLPVASTLPGAELIRADKPLYPPGAIREALINALMHRDYATYDGGVAGRMYPDRIEFWNSGALPQGMTVETLRQGYVSRPHNPDIAHVFLLRGSAERMGIGARRIVAECVEAGLPEPTWEEQGGGILLTLRRTPAVVAPKRNMPLSRRQAAFLEQTPSGERITAQEYHRRFAPDVSDRQARLRNLDSLLKWGMRAARAAGLRLLTCVHPCPNEQAKANNQQAYRDSRFCITLIIVWMPDFILFLLASLVSGRANRLRFRLDGTHYRASISHRHYSVLGISERICLQQLLTPQTSRVFDTVCG